MTRLSEGIQAVAGEPSALWTHPLYGFGVTLLLFLSGRVRFQEKDVGNIMVMRDGMKFRIFRKVAIKHFVRSTGKPEGLFIVRFTPRVAIQTNIVLSRFMLLIFMGFKGFRSKYWCVNEESGMCQGVYEWDKLEDAQRYSRSVAVRVMTRRSLPGSVSCQVLANTGENRAWQIVAAPREEKLHFQQKYHLAHH